MESQTELLLKRRHNSIGKYSPLFYEQPIHLARGEGVWLYDTDDNKFLDCYNNVPHVGHCHPKVVNAITQQVTKLNIHTRYLHENIVSYVERLTATFAEPLNAAMLTCTGSEANELALRMARFMSGSQGIIVTDAAYHGNTEAVGELGTGFMPEAQRTKRVRSFPIPDTYRGIPNVPPEALKDAYLKHIEVAINAFQEDGLGVAGMLVCPDFANEGLLNLPDGFLEEAAEMVRAAGGFVIFDEVQAGFGRTGKHMWAHQWYDVVPDIVTMGKPMGNGFPLAGIVSSLDNINAFTKHAMYFNTFGGTPVACAVGNAVLDALEEDNLLENAVTTGQYVTEGLLKLQEKFDLIGDVRSRGMFFGVELVLDKTLKTPAKKQAKQIVNFMRHHGVLISTIGPSDSVLKIRPPMPFKPEHADILLDALSKAFDAVSQEVGV
ncbi:aspartate aminotransferase family protein [Marinomonas shanghaiensis]|uniref:aspartate aminotransferase family protein n=1 Tax=Marinomonas shanghaiensis TaxID=2202418 RepID=UPI003A8DBD76